MQSARNRNNQLVCLYLPYFWSQFWINGVIEIKLLIYYENSQPYTHSLIVKLAKNKFNNNFDRSLKSSIAITTKIDLSSNAHEYETIRWNVCIFNIFQGAWECFFVRTGRFHQIRK